MRYLIAIAAVAGVAGAAAPPAIEVHATCATTVALDAATRTAHTDRLRTVLVAAFRDVPSDARFGVDASIAKLDVRPSARTVEIRAEVHLVLSDAQRRIQWMGTSGATVSVPAASYRRAELPALQREAVEHATRELVGPVRQRLTRSTDYRGS